MKDITRTSVDIQKECLKFFKDREEKDNLYPRHEVLVNYEGDPSDKVFRVIGLRRAGFSIAVQFTAFWGARQFETDMICLTRISCENILNFLKSQPKLS